jgi:hypothetical protein
MERRENKNSGGAKLFHREKDEADLQITTDTEKP